MKNKKNFMLVAMLMISTVVLINLVKRDLWDVNAEALEQELLTIGDSVDTVNLSDLTPFEWDEVYSFDPYTPKETIYETVGYKWDYISETVNEGMNQIVFLKNEEVVCYLYGYPGNHGYGINFSGSNKSGVTSASVLSVEDDLTFQVVRTNGVTYLNKSCSSC